MIWRVFVRGLGLQCRVLIVLDFLCFGGFYVEGCFWGFGGMVKIFFVIFLLVICRWHTGGNAVAMPWHCHGIALA